MIDNDVRRGVRTKAHSGPLRRGLAVAALALLLGLLMLLHGMVPNQSKNLGSLLETFLPWFGLFIPVLLVGALRRRSVSAGVALLLPIAVWLNLFGSTLVDKSQSGTDIVVASHNVGAENADPVATARDLAGSGADVLALVEMTDDARAVYERHLAQTFPFHTVQGTVGLWSKLPLSDSNPVDVKVGAAPPEATLVNEGTLPIRSLHTTVTTDEGALSIYVAHLGSVGVNPRAGFSTYQRDAGAQALAKVIAADQNERVVLLGDLNGTMDDRAFAGLTSQMKSVQDEAGAGFGFTWPATFPVVRIDHILIRGVEAHDSWVLPATGSDHRPVAAGITW